MTGTVHDTFLSELKTQRFASEAGASVRQVEPIIQSG